MARANKLIGTQFGRLTVVSEFGRDSRGGITWLCRCECGNNSVVFGTNLKAGRSTSCGCLNVERRYKHGHARQKAHTAEYKAWDAMIQRCHNPRDSRFNGYGARGIQVCERWRTNFVDFFADMGSRPDGTSIDRINNDGDYDPNNCRWVNQREQNRNRRNNVQITAAGETLCVTDWAARLGVRSSTIRGRLLRGWPPEKAVLTPVG